MFPNKDVISGVVSVVLAASVVGLLAVRCLLQWSSGRSALLGEGVHAWQQKVLAA
jgi:hypothetical protein